jgi:hypothetical protein
MLFPKGLIYVIDLSKMTNSSSILTISLLGGEAWGRQQHQVLPPKTLTNFWKQSKQSIFDHDSSLVVKLLKKAKR